MESEPSAAKAQAGSQPLTVQFTGCVGDQYFVPNARVAVQVDADDGESMAVRTSKGDEQVPRCLVARAG